MGPTGVSSWPRGANSSGLRIALAADCWRPTTSGVVTVIVQLARELVHRGHHVVVVTVDGPGAGASGVYRFPSLTFSAASGFRLGLAAPGAVLRILRAEAINVVHTHTEFSLGWAARGAARALGLPLVHTGHTLYEHYRHYLPLGRLVPGRLVRGYLRAFLRGYDALVCPSVKAQGYYAPLAPQTRKAIIGNGLSAAWLAPHRRGGEARQRARQALGIQLDERAVLYVGRMGPEKRVGQLFQLLLSLVQGQEGTRAIFAGCGPLLPAMRQAARKAGAEEKILFPGAVPWEEMPDLYLATDLFASASLSEVQPITLLEAAACGLPAVVRRDDAYQGLVEDGYNGCLADSDEQLAQAITRLLPDAAELRRLSHNAQCLAGGHSIEAQAARLQALYQRHL